jgi:hypothetical protein
MKKHWSVFLIVGLAASLNLVHDAHAENEPDTILGFLTNLVGDDYDVYVVKKIKSHHLVTDEDSETTLIVYENGNSGHVKKILCRFAEDEIEQALRGPVSPHDFSLTPEQIRQKYTTAQLQKTMDLLDKHGEQNYGIPWSKIRNKKLKKVWVGKVHTRYARVLSIGGETGYYCYTTQP